MVTNNCLNEPTATAGKVLQGQGVGTTSAFSTATYPATATGTGTILRADGTNWTATTTTYPNTNAASTLLYASSANVMAALATANTAVLTTDGSGVPSLVNAGTSYTPTAVGGTTAGSTTYTTQVGRYTQIGPLVVATFVVIGTFGATAAGSMRISLPVTAANIASVNWYGSGICIVNSVFFSGTYGAGTNLLYVSYFKYSDAAAVPVVAALTFNVQGTIIYHSA